MEYFIFIIMLGFASIVVLLFFSVISKNILIFSTLSLTVLLAIAIGFSLETGESNTSKKFQLGIKDRYIEQCMRPLSATTANIALIKEKIHLLNISAEELFLGTTKLTIHRYRKDDFKQCKKKGKCLFHVEIC